ncbi:chromosome segregation ATPase [Cupriavidus metallidurans]|uniref:hypothetical protein n=1 Tax=Cupriavidus metallidurans TaxID=119219 RepID=UPI000492F9D9|nr:hypothetical protein [Cupriavidus metallidurans]MDE4918595.1 hypothetical protein [Cupriavidus metallidurans]
MTWPLGTTVSRATRRLDDDIADLARDSTNLKRENATLRGRAADLEKQLRDAIAARDDLRQAHAVASAEALQLRGALRTLIESAQAHPYWPLHRWARFGPLAEAIEQLKTGTL